VPERDVEARLNEALRSAQRLRTAALEASVAGAKVEADLASGNVTPAEIERRVKTEIARTGAARQQTIGRDPALDNERVRRQTDEQTAAQRRLNDAQSEGQRIQQRSFREALAASRPARDGLADATRAAAAGGAPPGSPPRRPAAPPGGAGGEPPEWHRAQQAARSMAVEEARLRNEFQRTSVVLGQQSNELRRHGALTTEFITAAARGETTFRELGYQAGNTIGKFAGWLGAGAAVFFAADAVAQLGRGALDSESGVNQLRRVIPQLEQDAARVEFRNLAGEFNVPIRDATAAAFEMGKVFHDQDSAFKATRAVLNSVAVGELEVADASRFLIAIINGFKLPASDMAIVFDQINQAQNRFGVSIRDTEAGVAKAAGTYKAAGGDFSSLLALITTAQKVTGNTGEVIGTAIARAPNFLRKPQNVEVLAQFGIDATAPIPEIFQQAFEKARTLSGEELQKLAAAIGGPQYGARVFTPLLQNADKFKEVLRETSREASRGSAAKELDTSLESLDKQIERVGVSLQRLGGGLAQSGFGSVFVLGLGALNETLDVANALLDIFNLLPKPVRESLTLFIQIAAIMRFLRRFRFGDVLASRGAGEGVTNFFNQSPEQYRTRLARRGARDEAGYLGEDLTRATSERRLALREGVVIAAREREVQEAIAREQQVGNLTAERRQALSQEQVASEARVNASRGRVAELEQRQLVLTQELATVQERQALLANRRTRATAAQVAAEGEAILAQEALALQRGRDSAAAAQRRAYIPAELDRPTLLPPIAPTGPPRRQAQLFDPDAGNPQQLGMLPLYEDAVQQMEAEQRAMATTNVEKRRLRDAFRQSRDGYAQHGIIASNLIGAAGATREAANKVATDVRRTGGALQRAGSSLRNATTSLLGMLGPLDYLLIGGFAAYEAGNALKEKFERDAQRVNDLARAPRGPGDREKLIRELEDQASRGSGFLGSLGTTFRPLQPLTDSLDDTESRRRTAQERRLVLLREQQDARRSIQSGGINRLLTTGELDAQARAAVSAYEDKEISLTEFHKRINTILDNVQHSAVSGASAQERRAQQSHIRAAALREDPSNKNLFQRLSQIASGDLEKQAEAIGELAQLGAASNSDVQRVLVNLTVQATRLRGSKRYGDRVKLAQVNQQRVDIIRQQADEQLQEDLAMARGQEERSDAYERFFSQVRTPLGAAAKKSLQGVLAAIRRDQQQIANIRQEYQQGEGDRAPGIGGVLQRGLAAGQAAERIAPLLGRIRGNKRRLKEISRQLGVDDREVARVLREMEIQRYEDESAFRSAQTDVRQYRFNRGLPRVRFQIDRVGNEIQRAIRVYGRNSREVLQLMAQQQSLMEQAADEQFSILQARGELEAAGLEGKTLTRTQIGNIDEQLQFLRRNKGSESEILQLQAQRKSLLVELEQQAEDEARAAIESIYDLRIAQAEDPVRIARLELARDRALRRRLSPTSDANERRGLRAQEIRSQRGVRDAVVDSELEDIRFRAAIGKLTDEQQIRALRGLLRTHKTSRDVRRRIREQIYQLQHDADQEGRFDLNVGNIKLPTIYEIRRAVQTGQSGRSVTVQNRNVVHVSITDPSAVPAFAASMEEITGTSQSAFARAAGYGGGA
jgi:TP901 family phage tail tape measure protein